MVGVEQESDNLIPVLFLFVMQAAMDVLEKIWVQHNNFCLPSFTLPYMNTRTASAIVPCDWSKVK